MLEYRSFIDSMLKCTKLSPNKVQTKWDDELGAYEVYQGLSLVYIGDQASGSSEDEFFSNISDNNSNPESNVIIADDIEINYNDLDSDFDEIVTSKNDKEDKAIFSRNGVGIDYYENGQVHVDGSFKNDILDCEFSKIYYETGELFFVGSVKNGKLKEGEIFFPNRQIHFQGKFCKGLIHGNNVEQFSSSGRVYYQGGVYEGLYDGEAILYHNNGGISIKGRFKNGVLNDENVVEFFESGAQFFQGSVINGKKEEFGCLYYDVKENNMSKIGGAGIFGNSLNFVNPFMSINSGSGYFLNETYNVAREMNRANNAEINIHNANLRTEMTENNVIDGNTTNVSNLSQNHQQQFHINLNLRSENNITIAAFGNSNSSDILSTNRSNINFTNDIELNPFIGENLRNDRNVFNSQILNGGSNSVTNNRQNNTESDEVEINLDDQEDFLRQCKQRSSLKNDLLMSNSNRDCFFGYREGLFYAGTFKDDKPDGKNSKLFYKNGEIMYNGAQVLGKRESKGKFYDANSDQIFSGIFKNNKYYQGKLETKNNIFNLGDSLGTNFSNFAGNFKCEIIKGNVKFGLLKHIENSSRIMGNFKITDKQEKLQSYNDDLQEITELKPVFFQENHNDYIPAYMLNPKSYYLYKYQSDLQSPIPTLSHSRLSNSNPNLNTNNLNNQTFTGQNSGFDDESLKIYPEGFCKFYNQIGHQIYLGNCKNGVPDGKGMLYTGESQCLRAKGFFSKGKLCGRNCKQYDENSNFYYLGTIMPKYIGLFSKELINSRESYGTEYWKNGKIKYKGKYKNDSKNTDFGIAYLSNGSIYYVGGYGDGKFSGKGVCYWDSTNNNDEDNNTPVQTNFKGYGIRAFGSFSGGLLHGDECAIFDRQFRLRYYGRLEEGRKKEVGVNFDENGDAIINIIE